MNEDLIVADWGNHSARKVALLDGRVKTVAGSLEGGDAGRGYADGTGTAARFNGPYAVAVDGSNAILVADRDNHRVVMYASGATSGVVVAGGNGQGSGAVSNTVELAGSKYKDDSGYAAYVETTPLVVPTLKSIAAALPKSLPWDQ